MTEGQIALIISGISSLIALSIAIAAWRSARATKRATQSQLYIRLMEEYGSKEMSEATRGIAKFSQEAARELEKLKTILVNAQKLQDDEQLQAEYEKCAVGLASTFLSGSGTYHSNARTIKYYFVKVLRLYENGFLSEKHMRELAKVSGIDLFYDVIKLIEFVIDKDFDDSNFVKIEQICGSFKEAKKDESL